MLIAPVNTSIVLCRQSSVVRCIGQETIFCNHKCICWPLVIRRALFLPTYDCPAHHFCFCARPGSQKESHEEKGRHQEEAQHQEEGHQEGRQRIDARTFDPVNKLGRPRLSHATAVHPTKREETFVRYMSWMRQITIPLNISRTFSYLS